jgi:Ca2+:H+ antiporter
MSHSGPAAPLWSIAAPAAALAMLGATSGGMMALGGGLAALAAALMFGAVLAAVHHAEVIALKVGEPYGTIVLAIAVTVTGLIVTLILADPVDNRALPRDTVFAAIMIILGGVVGLCLLSGAARHHVQRFGVHGVNAALATLTVMAITVLIIPNFTVTTAVGTYSPAQLALVGTVSLALYGTFIVVQTVRHRDYFLPVDADGDGHITEAEHVVPPTNPESWRALLWLLACLAAVVLLAKALAPIIEAGVEAAGAPDAAVGVVIAAIVLLPEGLAAWRAARTNRLQTSLNLALGSALATIGLTIPAVAGLSLAFGWTLILGLDPVNMVMLAMALLVSTITLVTGRTTVMHGAVHLVIFALFLFLTVVP